MTRWMRFGLFTGVTIVAAFFATIVVCGGEYEADVPWVFCAALLIIFPCWLLLLSVVLRIARVHVRSALALVGSGALVSAAVITGEARYFFTHWASNAVPTRWSEKAAVESAAIGALFCAVYLLLLKQYGWRDDPQPPTITADTVR